MHSALAIARRSAKAAALGRPGAGRVSPAVRAVPAAAAGEGAAATAGSAVVLEGRRGERRARMEQRRSASVAVALFHRLLRETGPSSHDPVVDEVSLQAVGKSVDWSPPHARARATTTTRIECTVTMTTSKLQIPILGFSPMASSDGNSAMPKESPAVLGFLDFRH